MVVKATVRKLRVTEVPTTLSPDGRGRPPHLRSWRDGWRHLRFLLLFSPRGLFLYPGAVLFVLGMIGLITLSIGPVTGWHTVFDIHTMLYAAMLTLVGWQSVIFWICAKVHGMREGIVPEDPGFHVALTVFGLERVLWASLALFLVGAALGAVALGQWGKGDFGALSPPQTMRLVIPSVTAIMLAAQTVYGAAFLSVLQMRRREAA